MDFNWAISIFIVQDTVDTSDLLIIFAFLDLVEESLEGALLFAGDLHLEHSTTRSQSCDYPHLHLAHKKKACGHNNNTSLRHYLSSLKVKSLIKKRSQLF